MTNDLAIRILTGDVLGTTEQTKEAVTMAVRALSKPNVTDTNVGDTISRRAAIDEIGEWIKAFRENGHKESAADACLIQDGIIQLPSAQPETPPYVAEIESEYKKWVSMSHIDKPLAKALYEVWKKHDREDVSRNG